MRGIIPRACRAAPGRPEPWPWGGPQATAGTGLWCLRAPCRAKSTKMYKFPSTRQRATEQHIDYLRQLKPPRPSRAVDIDPKLHRREEEMRRIFGNPEIIRQPSEEELLVPPEAALAPTYAGSLGGIDLEPFGSIEVVHGDVFREQEAVIMPMSPNLMPYRGIGLEVCDRGGKAFVKAMFEAARLTCGSTAKGLEVGDTFSVQRNKENPMPMQHVLFVVMPWFWQGSPMDAAKRFRFCAKRALAHAAGSPEAFSEVAMPNIGGGIFGYEPRNSCHTLVEESIEALLQLEEEVPLYRLKKIRFVESRMETAELLKDALVEVGHRWLPERRMTTAPQYWSHATRRLLVLPTQATFFQRRNKVKFKKYHGVVRNATKNYIGNVNPWLWRPSRVAQPPPMMVFRATGEAAPLDAQRRARPYFFRGVTHWLFPTRKSGFHGLRRSAKGQWVARRPEKVRLAPDVLPRM